MMDYSEGNYMHPLPFSRSYHSHSIHHSPNLRVLEHTSANLRYGYVVTPVTAREGSSVLYVMTLNAQTQWLFLHHTNPLFSPGSLLHPKGMEVLLIHLHSSSHYKSM